MGKSQLEKKKEREGETHLTSSHPRSVEQPLDLDSLLPDLHPFCILERLRKISVVKSDGVVPELQKKGEVRSATRRRRRGEGDSTDEISDGLQSPDVAPSVRSRSSGFVENKFSGKEDGVGLGSADEAGFKREEESGWDASSKRGYGKDSQIERFPSDVVHPHAQRSSHRSGVPHELKNKGWRSVSSSSRTSNERKAQKTDPSNLLPPDLDIRSIRREIVSPSRRRS